MPAIYLTHAAEIWTHEGPTGDFAVVTAGKVTDARGNVLFAGSADECTAERAKYRIPTNLVPTEWSHAGEVAGADHLWQLVTVDA